MVDFNKTFNAIKSLIIGVKTTKIDDELDDSIKDILSYRSNSGRVGYVDYLQTLISKSANNIESFKNLNEINFGGSGVMGHEHGKRITRYQAYESITHYINYCLRALNVLVDNILSPDDIDKITLNVVEKNFTNNTDVKTKEIKQLLQTTDIEKNIEMIVKTTLHHGDFFAEITDNKHVFSTNTILSESEITKTSDHIITENVEYEYIDESNNKTKIKTNKLNIILDFESNSDISNIDDNGDISTQNVKIVYHRASQVVKLQSELYPICFGYLVFPRYTLHHNLSIEEQYINNICQKILLGIEKQGIELKNLNAETNEDLRDIVTRFIQKSNLQNNMRIRYVAPDKMQHFKVPSLKYYPYGESIFDACQFTAKLVVSLETSLTIQRISRSTDKRRIAIEIGLPRDASKLIQKMKEAFKKRKISIDNFGTVDTIPSNISTFEDVYIPQKDGKPFVDIDSFDGMGRTDIPGKTDEINMLISQLVASLGVPRQFIGLEENTTWKNTLSEENILFARTIIKHQKYLNDQITELVYKIYKIIDPDFSLDFKDRYFIHFSPPQSLQFERQSKYISDLVSMVRSLEDIGVPLEYSRRKYISQVDWDDVEKYKSASKLDKLTGEQGDEENSDMNGGF